MNEKAAVKDAAKRVDRGRGEDEIFTLSTGIRVRLNPVSGLLTEELRLAIPMPPVPVVWLEAKQREEENPNDPTYINKVKEVEMQRGRAAIDALIMFGVELVDGLPEDKTWLRKLKMLRVNLDGFDLEDPFDLEFLYKRHVAVAGADLSMIYGLDGLRPREVARARAMFLGQEERDTARGISPEKLSPDGDRDKPGPD